MIITSGGLEIECGAEIFAAHRDKADLFLTLNPETLHGVLLKIGLIIGRYELGLSEQRASQFAQDYADQLAQNFGNQLELLIKYAYWDGISPLD